MEPAMKPEILQRLGLIEDHHMMIGFSAYNKIPIYKIRENRYIARCDVWGHPREDDDWLVLLVDNNNWKFHSFSNEFIELIDRDGFHYAVNIHL